MGTQTVTATVQATTPDPDATNNTGSVSETPQRARVLVQIVPDPNNPVQIDISMPGTVTWYASLTTVATNAPPDSGHYQYLWFCVTASFNPCPDGSGLNEYNQPLSFVINEFGVDVYTLTLLFDDTSGNYISAQTQIWFVTTNTGGD